MNMSLVNECTDLEALQPEEVFLAAKDIIEDLANNPTTGTTEFLRNFLRDAIKHRKEERTSSSPEVAPHEDQLWIGEKLLVLRNKVIGKGSDGTIVYEGRYEDRPVAVKRLLRSHHELAEKEMKNLKASDQHRNIVRYHGVESDRDFVYLALELCHCNLDDLIQICSAADQYELVDNDLHCSTRSVTLFKEDQLGPLRNTMKDFKLYNEKNGRPLPILQKLMRDIVFGLVHLHELGMVHRDVKPQNILIIKDGATLCAKLSGMGISKKLGDNRSSFSSHSTGYTATGWKAPEQLLHGRQTREIDFFSLGCVLFFCITGGRHPFGDHDELDVNIKRDNKQNLFLIKDFPEAFHLISALLDSDPKKRPKAIEVLNHPLFWDAETRLQFLRDTSDKVSENHDLFDAIKSTNCSVLFTKWKGKAIKTWDKKMDDKIISHMKQYAEKENNKIISQMGQSVEKKGKKIRPYDYRSVPDLLRLIRNMLNHYGQLPKDIQILVGKPYEGFDFYFTSRFPTLLIEVYKGVCEYCKKVEYIKKYHEEEYLKKHREEEECLQEYFKKYFKGNQ